MITKKILLTFTALPLVALCFSLSVFAQGGVKGKLRNVKGAAISGATVTARISGRDVKTSKTDSKGYFTVQGLDAGVYSFVFDADGYSSGVKVGVEVKDGNVRDLGDRLILTADQGSQITIKGSVFFREGTSVPAAKVEIARVNDDGSTKSLGTAYTNISGEFTFRPPPGTTKVKVTARYKGVTGSREIVDIVNTGIYRTAITLDISRSDN
jgi:hypothetical protein